MKNALIYWIHTLSPTHVGTGRGLGYIDLPIHRDCLTGWPAIPATAFKGVWADHFGATDEARKGGDPDLRAAFGIAGGDKDGGPNAAASNAGALIPTDARLVCLPVRSFRGTFAWCTSRLALEFLRRDLEMAGFASLPPALETAVEGVALHPMGGVLTHQATVNDQGRIFLADLDFKASSSDPAAAWATFIAGRVFTDDAWREQFKLRFVVVPDEAFNFLCETATEIAARVRIDDEKKTVDVGALWNEELLPPEAILAGIVSCDRVYDSAPAGGAAAPRQQMLMDKFAKDSMRLQIGGKATTGRGQVRCVFSKPQGA
ncbi:MAG: type III-B CRISPR module RAMP protein Cmr4 [Phycisphaerae bacterium]